MVNSVLLPELSVPSFNFQLLNPPLQSELSTSPIMKEALGDHIFYNFIEAKSIEWDSFRTQVTDWEIDQYLKNY